MIIKLKNFFIFFIGIVSISINCLTLIPAQAENLLDKQKELGEIGQQVYGETNLSSPRKDIISIIVSIIKVLLSFVAFVLVLMILYSGYQWMTADGKGDDIQKAKDRIINATIGLIIILSAWGITTFIINQAICVTGDDGGIVASFGDLCNSY